MVRVMSCATCGRARRSPPARRPAGGYRRASRRRLSTVYVETAVRVLADHHADRLGLVCRSRGPLSLVVLVLAVMASCFLSVREHPLLESHPACPDARDPLRLPVGIRPLPHLGRVARVRDPLAAPGAGTRCRDDLAPQDDEARQGRRVPLDLESLGQFHLLQLVRCMYVSAVTQERPAARSASGVLLRKIGTADDIAVTPCSASSTTTASW